MFGSYFVQIPVGNVEHATVRNLPTNDDRQYLQIVDVADLQEFALVRFAEITDQVAQVKPIAIGAIGRARPEGLGNHDVENVQRFSSLIDALENLTHLGHLDAFDLDE